jgi:preprotein translocase subunit YajC
MPPGEDDTRGGMAEMAAHGVHGTVTAIAGDTLTVKTEDGASYKIETGVNTRFRKQRDPIKLADIHVGDSIAAFGDKDEKAKTLGAIGVMVFDKEQYEKARADFGKTWTAGAVQSIDDTKITIKRPDNAMQTIVVDENTSFRKHRDSITLADIKVGDNVTARGAVEGSDFLATTLSVGGPGGGNRGPRPGASGGTAAGATVNEHDTPAAPGGPAAPASPAAPQNR